jgi:hypothetical protein
MRYENIGETTSEQRYFVKENVRFAPIAVGNQIQIKTMKKFLIYGYFSRMVDCLREIKFLDNYDHLFYGRVFY